MLRTTREHHVVSSLISTTFISRTEGRNVKQTSKVWFRRLPPKAALEDPNSRRKLEKSKAIVSNMKKETVMVVSYNIFANSSPVVRFLGFCL